jgi:hypothetical protein
MATRYFATTLDPQYVNEKFSGRLKVWIPRVRLTAEF